MPETETPRRSLIARVTAWVLSLRLVRAFLLYSETRGAMLADSVTYRTLFSVFAAVLLGFSLAALWLSDNPQAWQALVDAVNAAVPGLVGEDGIVKTSEIEAPTGLTLAGVISLVGIVGASIGAIGSLRNALRQMAGLVHDDVFFLWVLLRNLGLALFIGILLVASAAATFFGTAGVGVAFDALGIPSASVASDLTTRAVSVAVVFALDTVVVAVLFRVLSGLRPGARSLWSGALLGGFGLAVLQTLSGLFVAGAGRNPLLTSFASLIALLLWFNLSAQVILIASAVIITGVRERADRERERHGAETMAQRRVRRAEDTVAAAALELREAREAAKAERNGDAAEWNGDAAKRDGDAAERDSERGEAAADSTGESPRGPERRSQRA